MGWLSKLFNGGGDQYGQIRDDYNIAVSPYKAAYSKAVAAAAPVDQTLSDGFSSTYTNLGRERAATAAAARYASALSPQAMQTAGGRAQAASVMAQTKSGVAAQEAENALNLEKEKLNLNNQNWTNRLAYADLQGKAAEYGSSLANAQSSIQLAGQQAKEAKQASTRGLLTSVAGSLLGGGISALGGKVTDLFTTAKSVPGKAAGGKVSGDVITGDGGDAPELVLNPTGAPLTIVPLTNRTTTQKRWVSPATFMPKQAARVRSPYARLPRYAGGGITRSVMFITGDGRKGSY
ncbi:MAG TPA: hypothetical protein PKM88_13755 [bacterium]|nr:hypothetical protein [bacterium]